MEDEVPFIMIKGPHRYRFMPIGKVELDADIIGGGSVFWHAEVETQTPRIPFVPCGNDIPDHKVMIRNDHLPCE